MGVLVVVCVASCGRECIARSHTLGLIDVQHDSGITSGKFRSVL